MIADAQLRQLVLEELEWDPKVDAPHIGVIARDGAVTLTGQVSSYASKYAATDAAKRVRGVRAVADEIEVYLPFEQRHDDSDIAQHIAHVLEWNVSIPHDTVKATVDRGFVVLSGEVESQHQREHIEKQVSHVGSVTGIANRIAIRSQSPPKDIKARIEDALRRNADLGARNLKVEVNGDTVTLSGKVRARYERELAERAAWSAPGVKYVVDQIAIE